MVRNPIPRTDAQKARYRNPDNDPRGPWLQGDNGTAKSGGESLLYPITLPSGRVVLPPKGNYWRFSKENFERSRAEGRVYFGANGDGMPLIKRYLTDVQDGVVPRTWWPAEEAGSNQSAKRDHLRKLLPDIEPFATPKPEELVRLIVHIASNPGDLVLDSFAGSGTTGAVAHKMGRRWIMVELGEHIHTHIIPRLRKVVDGEDTGGVTESTGWQGGGGFRYYTLAPSLIVNDRWGNPVINPEFNAAQLAEALAKLEGFNYAPSEVLWWQHGHSSERDFIYVTTQNLSADQLQALSDEVGPERSLLVGFAHDVRINIFNISKINSEVRGGKEPRIKRMKEVLGDSYFNHLANLPDLVLLMDESHRYRASAGVRSINELKPLFGLEVTATPFVESSRGPVPFKNVVMDYPLARAMEDGFVKEPAVVTQRNFVAKAHTPEEIEKTKLEDGVRLHETTKVELLIFMVETKARADINTQEVQAKAAAAMRWCKHASDHAANVGTKPWKYLLVPHDDINESKQIRDFMRFAV